MKCGYCGKKVNGNARYCSEYCRKKGESKENFARKTRIPLLIVLILSSLAAVVGIILAAAGKLDHGFLAIGGGLIAAGVGMLAFPRAKRGAAAFCQIGGGLFFALGLILVLLWA